MTNGQKGSFDAPTCRRSWSRSTRQLVRVQLSDRGLDGLVAFAGGLEQDAEFPLVLNRSFPPVKALDLGEVRAGGELALDESSGHRSRYRERANRRDDCDVLHGGQAPEPGLFELRSQGVKPRFHAFIVKPSNDIWCS